MNQVSEIRDKDGGLQNSKSKSNSIMELLKDGELLYNEWLNQRGRDQATKIQIYHEHMLSSALGLR